MDILSHALWVGVGAAVAQRTKPIENRTVGTIVALAVLPDVIHLLPILSWALLGVARLRRSMLQPCQDSRQMRKQCCWFKPDPVLGNACRSMGS